MYESKLYEVCEKAMALCRERGELSFTEIERIALAEEIRPSAVIDDLAISEDIVVDYAQGKVICRPRILTGDIWNRMTPIKREQLGIKAGLDAEARGGRWMDLFPEQKRALIREYKKEVPNLLPPED